jgi:hypothetical protein
MLLKAAAKSPRTIASTELRTISTLSFDIACAVSRAVHAKRHQR